MVVVIISSETNWWWGAEGVQEQQQQQQHYTCSQPFQCPSSSSFFVCLFGRVERSERSARQGKQSRAGKRERERENGQKIKHHRTRGHWWPRCALGPLSGPLSLFSCLCTFPVSFKCHTLSYPFPLWPSSLAHSLCVLAELADTANINYRTQWGREREREREREASATGSIININTRINHHQSDTAVWCCCDNFSYCVRV